MNKFITSFSRRFLAMTFLYISVPLFLVAQTPADSVDVDSVLFVPDTIAVDSVSELPWPQCVQSRLEKLLDHRLFQTTQVAMMVWDLDADSCIFRYNDRQLLRPASTMKVVTSIAALDRLGGSYQFKTHLRYTGSVSQRTLTGDVYCVGGMDPRFNNDDMSAFVDRLKELGVDTIRGNIYADLSMKDADILGEGWCWDDDNPQLSPLLIGKKNVFMDRFLDRLSSVGIVVYGQVKEGRCPQDAHNICTRSHAIDQILMRMMKESDNLYAESMLYQIAASTGVRPATAKSAMTVVKKLVGKIGLNASQYRFADGSGLSLYNYVSAELEARLLRYAWQNDNIFQHLYPSLPIAAVDGTLKKRMAGTPAAGNVHAKTGTLTGIISLAGYCRAANGHPLCFCIINQGVMHSSQARAFQDRVCVALCK